MDRSGNSNRSMSIKNVMIVNNVHAQQTTPDSSAIRRIKFR